MRGESKPSGGTGLLRSEAPTDLPMDLGASMDAEAFADVRTFPAIPASRIPIIPESSGAARLIIGFGSDSDVLLSGKPPSGANPVCATIYHTPHGWIAVDGALNQDGTIASGSTGLFVNGARVQGYVTIAANDVLQVSDVSGNPLTGDSFVFVDPLAEAPVAAPEAGNLELGDSWLRRLESDGEIVAYGSFRGLIDKYDENQDRAFYRVREDGIFAGIADGMGGHASGERSAEIGRTSFLDALDLGLDLEESINAMNAAMYESNQARHERGGAVFAGVHLHSDGRIEARTLGDGEVVVMSFPSGLSGGARLDYWSTRPSLTQTNTYHIPTLPDGRVILGCERTLRLDPDSNVVDLALGLHKGSMSPYQSVDWVNTEAGRIYFAVPMSDGMSEQYGNHAEMMSVVNDYVMRTGDVSPDGVRDALMRDALIRCSLARRAYREGRPFAITSSAFRQAYCEMTLEMDGVADPPEDLPVWRYQSRTDANGEQAHYYMVPAGGTAYVVRGVNVTGQGWMPDPYAVNSATGRLRMENPALADHPSIVGRFKQDNLSLSVVAFVREP